MLIKWIKLRGYRNFENAQITFADKALIIGSNDVGKTNLLSAIRLLLDRSLPEVSLEPLESDFHAYADGTRAAQIEITILLSEIVEDAVISKLKGYLSDAGDCYIKYNATLVDLKWHLSIGHTEGQLSDIEHRLYLKYIHLRYMQSTRDLTAFVRADKKQLLKLARANRAPEEIESDTKQEEDIKKNLQTVNRSINDLTYVSNSTKVLNAELKKLAHHNEDYLVNLESTAVDFNTFIEQLSLGARMGEKTVTIGGDGRNNQLLMALWKVKNDTEYDANSEAVIYCIEEPEAHLHPHQQRKISKYLITELRGQVLVTTHSPQITAEFSPNKIVRLIEKNGNSHAASNGCSDCIDRAWQDMSYRMSILPAEAFFSDCVLLVEGPSEIQFYRSLAEKLAFDLDYLNISILSVDGIAFSIYAQILKAMEIPFAMRTDIDVSKVPKSRPTKWRFVGLNRAGNIVGKNAIADYDHEPTEKEISNEWAKASQELNSSGVFVSKCDLEFDIGNALPDQIKAFASTSDLNAAVKYMQEKKALRMGEFVSEYSKDFSNLKNNDLAKPLNFCVEKVKERFSKTQAKRRKRN